MRPRTTGISATAQQQPQPPQKFKPKSEWKHETEASFLFVYLPGFAVDQLTITPDYSNRAVKVEGQRRLPNNRVLPVDETFNIPEDYDLSKMDKQLGRGILMLKMPRNIVITPQQESTKETEVETPEPRETAYDLVPRKEEETTDLPKETSTTGFEKQSPDISPPVTTTIDEKSTAMVAKSDEEKLVQRKEENDGYAKAAKPEGPESLVQNAGVKEKESKAHSKESDVTSATTVAAKVEEKKKERKKRRSLKPEQLRATSKQVEIENANASEELNENRKLIVNTGAAVLITMGLGFSLFYTLDH
ncbi:hypothetical protein PTKIN_Ptkin16aG0065900 [Pterospermum kingtungense]